MVIARGAGMQQPKLVIEEVTDPDVIARFETQDERARLNEVWLQEHWSDLLPAARGRFIAVAGQGVHSRHCEGGQGNGDECPPGRRRCHCAVRPPRSNALMNASSSARSASISSRLAW